MSKGAFVKSFSQPVRSCTRVAHSEKLIAISPSPTRPIFFRCQIISPVYQFLFRSFVVRVRPFSFWARTYFTTATHYKLQSGHRHKKGHAPRAIQGHSPTGISRPCIDVLRTRANFSAANTLLRSRASRGHLNLLV